MPCSQNGLFCFERKMIHGHSSWYTREHSVIMLLHTNQLTYLPADHIQSNVVYEKLISRERTQPVKEMATWFWGKYLELAEIVSWLRICVIKAGYFLLLAIWTSLSENKSRKKRSPSFGLIYFRTFFFQSVLSYPLSPQILSKVTFQQSHSQSQQVADSILTFIAARTNAFS